MERTIPTKIETVKTAVSDAERELRSLVGSGLIAPRAEKVEISEAVRAAFSKLAEARVKLIELDKSLAVSKIEGAKTAIMEAERNLDRVVSELTVGEQSDNTLVTAVVAEAFSKLKHAKTTLVELEEIIEE